MRAMFLLFMCAAGCASRVPEPPSISNEKPSTGPTRESNLSATVFAYYLWRNPVDNEVLWDAEYAIVLDGYHVFTEAPEDLRQKDGWELARLEAISIGPYIDLDLVRDDVTVGSDLGAWSARIAMQDHAYVVLRTTETMPITPVRLTTRMPGLDDAVYYIAGDPSGGALETYDGRAFGFAEAGPRKPGQRPSADLMVGTDAEYAGGGRSGVFNARHEFIGWSVDYWDATTLGAPTPAFEYTFPIATTRGLLRNLLCASDK